jgi:DNA-binding GntR family transcriptional regulator
MLTNMPSSNTLAPVTGQQASSKATELLRQQIITAQLEPGAPLNQSALAKGLGMSRIPVRDALIRLASQHLVDFRDGVPMVAPLSIPDLEEIYEMREAIEPAATRIALANVGRAEIFQMEELVEFMASTQELAAWLEANRRFHRLIYAQSNRTRMIAMIDSLSEQTDRYLFHYFSDLSDHLPRFDDQHRMILDVAREGAGAREIEDLTKLHLVTAHRMILGRLLDGSVQVAQEPSREQTLDT